MRRKLKSSALNETEDASYFGVVALISEHMIADAAGKFRDWEASPM
jgi:hypothetical protein